MSQNKKVKRKYLIDKKFQLGTALLVASVQIPCILATGLGLSWFYLIFLDKRLVTSASSGVLIDMAVVGLILTAAIIFFGIRLTHAVIGPVKRTGTVLRQMARNRPPGEKIKFRKKDWFKDLADDLNTLAENMKSAARVRSKTRESLEDLKQDLIKAPDPDRDLYIKKIDRILSRLS